MELALIAPIFFAVLLAIAEVGSVFLVQAGINAAVGESARLIRTGEAQTTGLSADEIRDRICAQVFTIIPVDCPEAIVIDVDSWPDFTTADFTDPLDASGEIDQAQVSFDPGSENAVVLVRVYFEWRVITPLMAAVLANMSDQRRLIVSSFMFRNEPFGNAP